MKKALVALLMVTSVNAFAGYTAEVCQTTESGLPMGCRMIRFKQKYKSPENSQDPTQCASDNQNAICGRPNPHVPALLNKINKWFLDRGFQTPAQQDDLHNN